MAVKADKGALARALKKAEALLRDMVALTLRGDLTRTQRTSLETCITLHMHQKESTGGSSVCGLTACRLCTVREHKSPAIVGPLPVSTAGGRGLPLR